MRIAITGATGFIGQYTVLELHAKGHQMVLLGRGEPISHLRLAEAINKTFGNKGNLKLDPNK